MLLIRMTKRLLLYIASLLLAMPMWAWQETVTVGAGLTQTLPTSVDSRVQSVADALGLTLLGWTPGEIADGQRPATYYGLGATVTPAAETTYYAMFARANAGGELIVRQCPSPADGDTVLLATIASGVCLLASNAGTTNSQIGVYLMNNTSTYTGSLMTISNGHASAYIWLYNDSTSGTFSLQSVTNKAYFLNVNGGVVKCGASIPRKFTVQNGFLYHLGAYKYLQYDINDGTVYWKAGSLPSSQSFAFYRKERYVDFATTIGQLPGCANCFIYVP